MTDTFTSILCDSWHERIISSMVFAVVFLLYYLILCTIPCYLILHLYCLLLRVCLLGRSIHVSSDTLLHYKLNYLLLLYTLTHYSSEKKHFPWPWIQSCSHVDCYSNAIYILRFVVYKLNCHTIIHPQATACCTNSIDRICIWTESILLRIAWSTTCVGLNIHCVPKKVMPKFKSL